MRVRRAAGALLAAGALSLAVPAPASAHVHLTSSVPADGARLTASPATVRLRFNGAVEERFARATLFDGEGREHRLGLRRATSHELVAPLSPGAGRGQTAISYRVLSSDGHPIAGAIAFVGAPRLGAAIRRGAAPGGGSRRGALRPGAERPATAVLAAARGLQYGAIAVMLGGGLFLALVWLPALGGEDRARGRRAARALRRRWRTTALGATAVGLVSALAALGAHAALAQGGGAALSLALAGDALATRSGAAWGVAILAWLAVAAVLAGAGRRADHPRVLMALTLPLGVLVLVPATSGHAGRDGVLLAANAVHVGAISAWLGGLVGLLLATRAAAGPASSALRAALVARFSLVALVAMAALTLTGGLQSALLLDGPGALLTSGYGRLLGVKITVTAGLLALGARQRRRAAAPGGAVLATARLEMVLGLLVLATTAILAGEAARA